MWDFGRYECKECGVKGYLPNVMLGQGGNIKRPVTPYKCPRCHGQTTASRAKCPNCKEEEALVQAT